MKKLIALFSVFALVVASGVANADDITFDNGGAGWLFDENNPLSIQFDFDPNPSNAVTINSVSVDMSHTWSGDVDFQLVGPAGALYNLMDNQGGSTDLGGLYTFIESGGGAAGTYAAGGPGIYDANVWTPGFFPKVGWFLNFTDTAGGDDGFINSVSVNFDKGVVIPEPTSALVILGMGGLALVRRRR